MCIKQLGIKEEVLGKKSYLVSVIYFLILHQASSFTALVSIKQITDSMTNWQ